MDSFNRHSFGRIVILTGAGISAESGLNTFRDSGGLWENHDPMTIATPEAFARDPGIVYRFYNARRSQLAEVHPNPAHEAIARLQTLHPGEVRLVTQNVDDLHERGGSKQVCHMHGELLSRRCLSCEDVQRGSEPYDTDTACPSCGDAGNSLRPDIVWFGEVPMHMEQIFAWLEACELFIAIGTSGAVYPAAGFVRVAGQAGAVTLEINRQDSDVSSLFDHHIQGLAGETVPRLVDALLAD
jgi:NAD-dependent deacetylase